MPKQLAFTLQSTPEAKGMFRFAVLLACCKRAPALRISPAARRGVGLGIPEKMALDGGAMYRGQHKYTVELRVRDEEPDPEVITRETGLQPCQTRYRRSPRGEGTWDESLWAFDGGYSQDWDSLSDGLIFVLDRLRGYEEFFKRYAANMRSCGGAGTFRARSTADRHSRASC